MVPSSLVASLSSTDIPLASNHAVLVLSGVETSRSGAVAVESVVGSRKPSVVTKSSFDRSESTPAAPKLWQFSAVCSLTKENVRVSESNRHTYTRVTMCSSAWTIR